MRPIKLMSAAAMTVIAVQVQAGVQPEKPNFIIILCDDMGYGDLGCFGNPTIVTPNIDKMACEGMKMTQFYTGAPTSTPSRSSIMTGHLPVRNGMYGDTHNVLFPDSKSGLAQDEITIPTLLKQGGYSTACIGKWHLGCFEPYLPTNHGFDYFFGLPYSNDMGKRKNGRAKNYPLLPLMQGTEVIEQNPDQSQITIRYTEQANDFIRQNVKKPFFLYLAHAFPHVPLFVSDRFKSTSARGLYGDVVQEIDWSVGQIMNTLKECGIDKNTIVVFTSDNGPWLAMKENGGSAGLLKEGKGTWCEGGFRVPTIIRMPEKIAPATNTQVMTTMDLLPTFLSMAHVAKPEGLILDGVDQSPMLFDNGKSGKDAVYYWWGSELMAIRKGDWKYYFNILVDQYMPTRKIVAPDSPMLYNLGSDPSEKYNCAEKHPQIIEMLKKEAETHKQSITIKASVCDQR